MVHLKIVSLGFTLLSFTATVSADDKFRFKISSGEDTITSFSVTRVSPVPIGQERTFKVKGKELKAKCAFSHAKSDGLIKSSSYAASNNSFSGESLPITEVFQGGPFQEKNVIVLAKGLNKELLLNFTFEAKDTTQKEYDAMFFQFLEEAYNVKISESHITTKTLVLGKTETLKKSSNDTFRMGEGCKRVNNGKSIQCTSAKISEFTDVLSSLVGMPVLDETNLFLTQHIDIDFPSLNPNEMTQQIFETLGIPAKIETRDLRVIKVEGKK